MKKLSSIFNTQASTNITPFYSNRTNRRIFVGDFTPSTRTWVVPEGTTKVEVHAWGGGGNGSPGSTATRLGGGGGGGGGYVSHLYLINPGDTFNITLGGAAGTTSVSVPTNSSPQPISATGGSPGSNATGGPGGSGSFASVPVPLRSGYYTKSISGSSGGSSIRPAPTPSSYYVAAGGGGAAGFHIYGGSAGGNGNVTGPQPSPPFITSASGGGGGYFPGILRVEPPSPVITAPNSPERDNYSTDEQDFWYYIEEIATQPAPAGSYPSYFTKGSSPPFYLQYPSSPSTQVSMARKDCGMLTGGPGGPVGPTFGPAPYLSSKSGRHAIIGGGGGGGGINYSPFAAAPGGQGGVGCVIIYW